MTDATTSTLTPAPQIKVGPALSAVSDAPELNLSNADPVAPAADPVDPKPDANAAPDAAAKPDADAKPDAEPNPDETPAWMKARITKEANKARAAESARVLAERKADQLSANLTKALESIETLTKRDAASIAKEHETQDPRPNRESFDTPDAYDSALIDWSARKAALVAKAETKAELDRAAKEVSDKAANDQMDADNRRTLDEFAGRKAKFIEDHPDYEELVDAKEDLPISIPMANVILTDDDGPAIAYYLGQNPDEAARISALPPVRQVSELGRIAQRLNTKPAVSTKPAPIKPLKVGSEAASRKGPNEESMAEYAARRGREIANDKRTRLGLPPLN